MLSITLDEVENLRLKLLAGIYTGAIAGEDAEASMLVAKDLAALSGRLFERDAFDTVVGASAAELSDLLQAAIESAQIPR